MPVFVRFRENQFQVFPDQRECFAGTSGGFIDSERQLTNYELRITNYDLIINLSDQWLIIKTLP